MLAGRGLRRAAAMRVRRAVDQGALLRRREAALGRCGRAGAGASGRRRCSSLVVATAAAVDAGALLGVERDGIARERAEDRRHGGRLELAAEADDVALRLVDVEELQRAGPAARCRPAQMSSIAAMRAASTAASAAALSQVPPRSAREPAVAADAPRLRRPQTAAPRPMTRWQRATGEAEVAPEVQRGRRAVRVDRRSAQRQAASSARRAARAGAARGRPGPRGGPGRGAWGIT